MYNCVYDCVYDYVTVVATPHRVIPRAIMLIKLCKAVAGVIIVTSRASKR